MTIDRCRIVLILGAVFALSAFVSTPAHAERPDHEASAALARRLAHSARVRFLTLAGHVEAGHVSVTGDGFASPDLRAAPADSLSPAGILPWDAVLAVDVQVSQADRGAVGGGLFLGVVGLLIGFAGGVASPMGEVGKWSMEGAAAGVGIGAVLGGLIGAPQHRWARVYPEAPTSDDSPRKLEPAPDTTEALPVRVLAIAPLVDASKGRTAEEAAQTIREGIVRELTLHSDANTVSIQPLEETDRRLREASSSNADAARLPAGDLCKLLGADAVLMGAITRYRQRGGLGSLTLLLLMQPTAHGREVEGDFAICAGPSGRVLWRQNVRTSTGLFSSAAMLGSAVGATVADKFPYRRKPVRH